jgi:hypothetical protein
MTNYTQYYVMFESDVEELEKLVNRRITQGWQPLGGVCAVMTHGAYSLSWAQAMVK